MATIRQLMEGETVEGLDTLPIEAMVSRIASVFADGATPGTGGRSLEWVSPDEESSFEVETSPQHVLVELRPLVHDTANTLIDLALEFDCPLYDAKTNERFVQ